jgi:heat shock protein HtpX
MLYKQIEQNKKKTILLVLLFTILVLAVGSAFGYLMNGDLLIGLVIAAVIMLFYLPITYMSANAQVLKMSGAKPIEHKDNPALFNMVENLALAARIPTPKIYIIEDPALNAFASGIKPEKGVVAFTTGLLSELNREELEAVAAHEIGHIRNYDIRLMTICIALVGVIALLAHIGTRMLFVRRGGGNRKTHPALMIIALVLVILSPFAARFVQLAVSRNREYLADASAVELTRNSMGMRNALAKIGKHSLDVQNAKEATASMYISNPFRRDRKKTSWFSTHPTIESRIERLERM